jgi:hypothetical protein
MGAQQEKRKAKRALWFIIVPTPPKCVTVEPIFERAAEAYHGELVVPIFGGKPGLNKHALNMNPTDDDPCRACRRCLTTRREPVGLANYTFTPATQST